MRLIDADKLIRHFEIVFYNDDKERATLNWLIDEINEKPTVEAIPIWWLIENGEEFFNENELAHLDTMITDWRLQMEMATITFNKHGITADDTINTSPEMYVIKVGAKCFIKQSTGQTWEETRYELTDNVAAATIYTTVMIDLRELIKKANMIGGTLYQLVLKEVIEDGICKD